MKITPYYKHQFTSLVSIDASFYKVHVDDLLAPVERIMTEILDYSWLAKLNSFDQKGLCANMLKTIPKLISDLDLFFVNPVNGEILVSYIGKYFLNDYMNHNYSFPTGEVLKQKTDRNPGFDFYSVNKKNVLIFGEAKYLADDNAYNSALKQIAKFIAIKNDDSDSKDLKPLLNKTIETNYVNGLKGYCASFSIKEKDQPGLNTTILNNDHFKEIINGVASELICIGVFLDV